MKRKFLYKTSVHVFRAMHNKMTQKDLADAVGLTRQTIGNIESDQPPTLLNAMLIAKYFEVPIEEIFKFEQL